MVTPLSGTTSFLQLEKNSVAVNRVRVNEKNFIYFFYFYKIIKKNKKNKKFRTLNQNLIYTEQKKIDV
jgi:hypothetical protein